MPYLNIRSQKVNSLTVKVGVLANVLPAAFEFAFEALTDDTIFHELN